MTREYTRFKITPRKALFLTLTTLLVWGTLLVGRTPPVEPPQVGEPSPETYFATEPIVIVDEQATEAAKEEAAQAVPTVYQRDGTKVEEVRAVIQELFEDVREGLEPPPNAITPVPQPPVASPASTVPAEQEETPTTAAPPAEVFGLVFVDADGSADYLPEAGDGPLAGVEVDVYTADGSVREVMTDALGVFRVSDLPAGFVGIHIDYSASSFPDLLAPSTGPYPELEVESGAQVEIPSIGFSPVTQATATQEAFLAQGHRLLDTATISKLVALATGDVVRLALKEHSYLDQVEIEALKRAEDAMAREIQNRDDLDDLVQELYDSPRTVFFDDGTADTESARAVSDIVAKNIQVNMVPNPTLTEEARQAARDAVVPVEVPFRRAERIVNQGDLMTAVQLEALSRLGLIETGNASNAVPMLLIVVLAVAMLSLYLLRFRPNLWSVDRRVALFGLLLVLGVIGARAAAILAVQFEQPAVGYLIPATGIGLMAAILFDGRIAVLLAVGLAALTALATESIPYTLFAGLAAIVPVPFASAISSRGNLRQAVALSAVTLAVLAAPIAWLFHSGEGALEVVAYATGAAFLNGLIGGLVAIAALSFLEIIFDVTTTLRLLDMSDRNHPALQLLEENARGTFNHSLMVGTLADRAARAIGANHLLAQSAAYYHDLGKTENPSFYIENQFGGFNPHNQLLPQESAQIIRQHVIDGIRLAKEYRIPSDVSEGILTHHGDGIMRYFYHKALERYPDHKVDVETYRHIGHKPRSREMAILMLADALEGACRAVFAERDPSPESIAEVVENVIAEKLSDGQLSESDLTMGELTRVKEAFTDALIGNYHQRIPYPGFPQLREGRPAALAPPSGGEPSPSPLPSADVE